MKEATEKRHKEVLIKNCYRKENDRKIQKTKTAFVLKELEKPEYERGPSKEILVLTKKECKILIIARFSMLE